MLKPRHPLVVLDWNFFEAVAPARFKPPWTWDFLLPDEVIHEVLDKPDSAKITAVQHLRKLLSICSLHKHRIWLAMPADCLMFCSRRLTIRQMLGPRATPLDPSRTDSDLLDMLRKGRASTAHSQYEKRLREFTSFIAEYRQWFQQTRPHDRNMVHDLQWCCELVRNPLLLRDTIRPEDRARLSLTDAQLAAYPDALPCCRWLRLVCWYVLRYATKPAGAKTDADAANSFADASYAFLSSYTGHLLTNDGGCQAAGRALRPGLRIWIWDQKERRLVEKCESLPS